MCTLDFEKQKKETVSRDSFGCPGLGGRLGLRDLLYFAQIRARPESRVSRGWQTLCGLRAVHPQHWRWHSEHLLCVCHSPGLRQASPLVFGSIERCQELVL